MNRAEAEAVLLALRGSLLWKSYPARDCPEKARWDIAELKDGNITYTVSPFYQGLRVTSFCAAVTYQEDAWGQGVLFPEKQRSPHRYTTRGAAIAACERHYATGKWD